MAWRAPRYSYIHAAREAGIDAITSNNTVHADYPLARLIDERRSVNMRFNSSETDHYINRLYIPIGHNFTSTTDIRLQADDNDTMSSPTTLISHTGAGANVGTDAIDIEFSNNQERYVRLDWPSQDGQWEIPELWLTYILEPNRGPEPNWTDQYRYNALAIPKASGERPVIETGVEQREFSFSYARLDATDTIYFDLIIVGVGLSKPFIFDPPYDDEDAVVVRFARPPRTTWDHPVPTAGTKTKRFEFELIEVIE